ncbi:MAG: ABC transporter substrate-binding protein [Rubrobacter sp.]|nr:ABC transporter substrate-binding protein [Rubrobacter sp.]
MSENLKPERISRRNFLKTAGMATGALTIPPLLSATLSAAPAEAAPKRRRKRRKLPPLDVAVLAPPSRICPSLGRDLTSGMRLRFAQTRASGGRTLRLKFADAGIGEGRAMQTAEKAIEGGAALTVGFVPPRLAANLAAAFEKKNKAFIALDTGADIARRDEPESSNSLLLWRSEFAFGGWAAKNLGQRAVTSASAYDGGFDAYHAFRLGFEGAGGEMLGEHITHLPGRSPDLSVPLSEMKQTAPDFVYAAYCGKHAVEFVGAYAKADLENIPLAGSAFLADECILAELGASALGIKTCLSWASGLQTAANRRFVAEYRKKERRAPGAVAALGYETAAMISAALEASKGNPNARFRTALANASIIAPRGRVKMGPTNLPVHIREVRRSGKTIANAVIARASANGSEESLAALRGSPKTGWLNTYLTAGCL